MTFASSTMPSISVVILASCTCALAYDTAEIAIPDYYLIASQEVVVPANLTGVNYVDAELSLQGHIERLERADAFVAAPGADICHGWDSAYFTPSTDHIQMLDTGPMAKFVHPQNPETKDGRCLLGYRLAPLHLNRCQSTGAEMKRLTGKQKARSVRLQYLRQRRRLLRAGRMVFVRRKRQPFRISAPKVLSFSKNFAETVAFLDEFRERTVGEKAGRSVYVDLVPVKTISVPVAIVLAAEFHRWSIVRRIRLRIRDHEQWAPSLRTLFSDLGVFNLLGIKGVREEANDQHVTLTKLESGLSFDGPKIAQLQARFRNVLAGFMYRPSVYDGLTEAAENAIWHGYPTDYISKYASAGKRWWGASCIDLQTMRLRFFIFDQGAGIPHTLPSVGWYESVVSLMATLGLAQNDTLLIRAALEVARTRTGDTHRGLGLNRMVEVIEGSESGYLRIISGKGEIVVHSDRRIEEHPLDQSIGGTLIEWNFPTDIFTNQAAS